MAVSAAISSAGSPVLVLSGQSDQVEIPVKFSSSVPSELFEKICAVPRFISWANSYLPRPQQRLKLQSITFESVETNDDNIGFIKLHADVLRTPENSQVGGTILLNGPSAAVLVVLRVNTDGSTAGSENAPVLRPDDPEAAQQSGPRPREYVLFVKQARPAVGAPEHREMPSGQLGADGSFTGPAFTAIHSSCGLRFYESQMEDMTSLALSARRTPARSLGVSLSPSVLDERVRLYLYRETVSREFIEAFQKRRATETESITIDLWTLNDAWRITSDAKTLSALFLFHELRYHQLMPRYRPPRETKRSPTYTAVADLNPNRSGLNLRVKIAEPLKMIPHPTRPGTERGVVVVGDSTGVVTLSLDPSQTGSVPGCSTDGTPLFLRNVEFDMSDGHITIILDSFGKASSPSSDEMAQFNFTPNKANDVSATEYEKVFQPETSTPSSYNYPSNTSTRGRGGMRDGGRGRGRGRGGPRNGFYY